MTDIESNRDCLLHLALALPQGDDAVWRAHKFCWKMADTWTSRLSAWLAPKFRKDGIRRLKPGRFRDLPWDAPEWHELLDRCLIGDIEHHTEALADALEPSILRVFHGCRTGDAGTYFREGLRLHDRDVLKQQLIATVEQNEEIGYLKNRLDSLVADIDNALDIGRLYVVADDSVLLKRAAHYLIYGSEWITAVLGYERRVLLKTGAPTLIEIDLPLRVASPSTRAEFARKLLAEWTRRVCNQPDWHAPIDFSFCLRTSIPPEWIVGHSHPARLPNPLEHYQIYTASRTRCAYC